MPHVVIGAGGAVETALLPSHIVRLRSRFQDISISVAISPGATKFVTDTALRGISGGTVYSEHTDFHGSGSIPNHMVLAQADLIVLFPCTARIIAECALGIISCPVTRLFSFSPKSNVVVTPYLHPDMTESLYTSHIDTLKKVGCTVIKPKAHGLLWKDESAWLATEAEIASRLRRTNRDTGRLFEVSPASKSSR
ncbi:flavoprotein [Paraburkholderia tropica]|uniref:flavoprotein n=1 Tax=Paraburkholderia tropica TaxID=92647 RepID=UPI0038BC5DF4